jgi:hypothetical protein
MSTVYEDLRGKDLSPKEKLRDAAPLGIEVPGAENPESVEIRKERNPNTE